MNVGGVAADDKENRGPNQIGCDSARERSVDRNDSFTVPSSSSRVVDATLCVRMIFMGIYPAEIGPGGLDPD